MLGFLWALWHVPMMLSPLREVGPLLVFFRLLKSVSPLPGFTIELKGVSWRLRYSMHHGMQVSASCHAHWLFIYGRAFKRDDFI